MRFVVFACCAAASLFLVPPAGASQRSAALTAQGVEALARGDRDGARELLRAAVEADPADADAWYHAGRAALLAGDTAAAVASLERARAAGYPDSFSLGVAYRAAKRPAEAEQALRDSVAYEPRNLEARYFLGLVLTEQGRAAEAKAHLEAAKAAAPLRDKVAALERGDTGPKPWYLTVDVLHQTDTNVILAQTDAKVAASTFSPEEISNKRGNRAVALVGGGARFALSTANRLSIGYAGYHSYHWSGGGVLANYDVSSHALTLRDEHRFGKFTAGLGLAGGATLLGLEGYSTRAGAAPRFVYAVADRQSASLDYELGVERFVDKGAPVTLGAKTVETDRANVTHAVDLGYTLAFGKRGYVAPSAGYVTSDAKGESVWDYAGPRLRVRALAPIGAAWGVALGAGYAMRAFAVDALAVSAAGVAFEKRDDAELAGEAALRYEWSRYRAQAGAAFTRNTSSVDAFDYSRTIFSLGLGASL